MTRYLVTGGGLIGSAISRALAVEHEVAILDREDLAVPEGAEFVKADLRSLESVLAAVSGVDAIFHTAAIHGIHLGSHTPRDFFEINVQGTFNILEAAAQAGIPRVVHSSTTGVFGLGAAKTADGYPHTLTEATPLLPADPYGHSKVICEELCRYYTRARGVATVALRYGAVKQLVERFGPFTLGHAIGGGITDVADALTANLHAMDRAEELQGSVHTILPTTLFDEAALRAAGDDIRGALLRMLPELDGGALPAEVPQPSLLYDASGMEQALGMKFAGTQRSLVLEAIRATA